MGVLLTCPNSCAALAPNLLPHRCQSSGGKLVSTPMQKSSSGRQRRTGLPCPAAPIGHRHFVLAVLPGGQPAILNGPAPCLIPPSPFHCQLMPFASPITYTWHLLLLRLQTAPDSLHIPILSSILPVRFPSLCCCIARAVNCMPPLICDCVGVCSCAPSLPQSSCTCTHPCIANL